MSRKQKWKGVPLNHTNIDEYMKDLHNSTSSQYITQGVSFNKDDNFQMNLLKNALISHGSFSGFVKHLLFTHFETHGKIADDVWLPNEVSEPPTTQESTVENESIDENEPDNTNEIKPEKESHSETKSKEPVETVKEEVSATTHEKEEKIFTTPSSSSNKDKPNKNNRKLMQERNISQYLNPPKQ